MKGLAKFIKVLSDANRLAIIRDIGRESMSVTEIINATGLSQTLVSFHLRALRDTGVVSTRREGPFIYYSLTDKRLIEILDELARSAGLANGFSNEPQSAMAEKISIIKRR